MTKYIVTSRGEYLGAKEDTYELQVGEVDTEIPPHSDEHIMKWSEDDWIYLYGVDDNDTYMGLIPVGNASSAKLLVDTKPMYEDLTELYGHRWLVNEHRWGLKPDYVTTRMVQERKEFYKNSTAALRLCQGHLGNIRTNKTLQKRCYSVFSSAEVVADTFEDIRRVFPEFVKSNSITDFSYIAIGGTTPHLVSLSAIRQSGKGYSSSALGQTYFFNLDSATYYKETRCVLQDAGLRIANLADVVQQDICGVLTSDIATTDNYGNPIGSIVEIVITPNTIDEVVALNAWVVATGIPCEMFNTIRKEVCIATLHKESKEVLQVRQLSFDRTFIRHDPTYSGETLRARSIISSDPNLNSDNARWKGV